MQMTLLQAIAATLEELAEIQERVTSATLESVTETTFLADMWPTELLDRIQALEDLLPSVPHLWSKMHLSFTPGSMPTEEFSITCTPVLNISERLVGTGFCEPLRINVKSHFTGHRISVIPAEDSDDEFEEAIGAALDEAFGKMVQPKGA